MSHGLGRRHAPDARDLSHLMRAALPKRLPARPVRKTWILRWHGDQGETSQCVGYAWYGLLRASPVLNKTPLPEVIYQQAQLHDEFPETPPEEGSSVRGGAKALQLAGKITAYAWAFDIQTVLTWIGLNGPVCLGTNWHQSMFTPDATGLVVPTGPIVGGHAYVAIGYDDSRQRLICQNSWEVSWGLKGRFALRYADAEALIQNMGEACTPTEQ